EKFDRSVTDRTASQSLNRVAEVGDGCCRFAYQRRCAEHYDRYADREEGDKYCANEKDARYMRALRQPLDQRSEDVGRDGGNNEGQEGPANCEQKNKDKDQHQDRAGG